MADKKIVYSLDFQADTKNAQGQLDRLKTSLNALASQKFNLGSNISKEMEVAANAAIKMQGHLKNALDPSTGKLDLARLSTSLKNSGDNAKTLGQQFLSAGNLGKKAFLETANAIANAQKPMIKTNALMNNLWISLKNTAKWQISSAVLGSFTKSLSSAVSFAKELNKSLNDIRIVSGDSADQMERFAKQANKMAKELGTSTTDITKGTLIYRQQGDAAEQAAKKAQITAKAAAVTTESTAEEMSEYLTGIWNSYQVGSDELELFVDKLAYVGATTATSMEEIATSMTKVAATANTVGVEYEQLLGIIATVSSATRVSAEQVGTAYKTILARMGDLQIEGSVEEDGITVTLGDISSTLKQVGIDVLDANGNLRDMGSVIEQLGNNWDSFSTAEKTAIANTIAGKRQYTQLFALFDNWDKYRASVEGAADAQGTLNEQHKIYLESWEAASKNVKASVEGLTMDFFNDEAIISATNHFAELINIIDKTIDSIGGFGTLLLSLGGIFSRVFSTQIANGLTSAYTNLLVFFGQSERIAQQQRAEWENLAKSMVNSTGNGFTIMEKKEAEYLASMMEFQSKYEKVYKNLTSYQKIYIDNQLKQIENEKQLINIQNQNRLKEAEQVHQGEIGDLTGQLSQSIITSKKYKLSTGKNLANRAQIEGLLTGNELDLTKSFKLAPGMKSGQEDQLKSVQLLKKAYAEVNKELDLTHTNFQELGQVLSQSSLSTEEINGIVDKLGKTFVKDNTSLKQFIQSFMKTRVVMEEAGADIEDVERKLIKLNEEVDLIKNKPLTRTEVITNSASALMSLTSGIYSAANAFKTFTDEEATLEEQLMTLGMTIPMVLMSLSQVGQSLKTLSPNMVKYIADIKAETLAHMVNTGAMTAEEAASKKAIIQKDLETMSTRRLTAELIKQAGLKLLTNPVAWVAAGVAVLAYVGYLNSATKAIKDVEKAQEEYNKTSQKLEETNRTLEEKERLLEEIEALEPTQENKIKQEQYSKEIELLKEKAKILEESKEEKKEDVEKKSSVAAERLLNDSPGNVTGTLPRAIERLGLSNTGMFGRYYKKSIGDLSDEDSYISKLYTQLENINPETDKDTYDKVTAEIERVRQEREDALLYEEALEVAREKGEKDIEKYAQNLVKKIKKEKEDVEALKKQEQAEEKKNTTIDNTIATMEKYDAGFDAVNSSFSEFKEKGSLSYESIKKLKDAFGEKGDMKEFYEQLALGNVTFDEFKLKMEEATEAIIAQDIAEGKLKDMNVAMLQSYLKSKGVTNSAAVAQDIYNKTLIQNKIATEKVVDKKGNLTEAILTEGSAAGLSKTAMAQLTLQEKIYNNTDLSLEGKIKEMGKYAGVIAAAGVSILNLSTLEANLVGKEGDKHFSKSFIKDRGYKSISSGKDLKSVVDNIFEKDGKRYTYQEVEQILIGATQLSEIKIDLGNIGLGGIDNGKDSGGDLDKISLIDAKIREISQNTVGYLEENQINYDREIALLDEEKGQINEIIKKNKDNLDATRQLVKGNKDKMEQLSTLFGEESVNLGFTSEETSKWFDKNGEESLYYLGLLSKAGEKERESLQYAFSELQKIKNAIEEAENAYYDKQAEEVDKERTLYENEIKAIDMELSKLEFQNERLENSPYMDYDALHKNYGLMQDYYKQQYETALATEREAAARAYLAKLWEIEAKNIESVTKQYEKQKEIYEAIADELKRRYEEEIEALDKRIERINSSITLDSKYFEIINKLRSTQHEINKELQNSMLSEKYLSEREKEKIFNAKDYLLVSEKISEIEEDIQENYEDYIKEINSLQADELYHAELLTKEFEKQTAEKERELEILRAEIDLVKKRNALNDALAEKNVRVFQGGRWVQIANRNDVQNAASALQDAEYSLGQKRLENEQNMFLAEKELRAAYLEDLKNAKQAEIDLIDEQIEEMQRTYDKWNSTLGDLDYSLQGLQEAFKSAKDVLESDFGIKYSGSNRDNTSNSRVNSSVGASNEINAVISAKQEYANAKTDAERAAANQKAEAARESLRKKGLYATAAALGADKSLSSIYKTVGTGVLAFASGTDDTPEGVARVNEKGLELYATSSGQFIELSPHGKIFNNDQFDYLYTLSKGKTSMDASSSQVLSIGQMNLTLPNVTNTESFVEGLKNLNAYIKNTKNL